MSLQGSKANGFPVFLQEGMYYPESYSWDPAAYGISEQM